MGGTNSQESIEHELLLEVIFERVRTVRLSQYLPFRQLHNPIQGVPLRLGFKATNLAKSPFPGATVKAVVIARLPHASMGNPVKTVDQDFSIPTLNRRTSYIYWFPEPLVLHFDGTAWVSCDLV